MADLDAELLALAGDTSDEGESKPTSRRGVSPRPASTTPAPPPTKAATPKKVPKARPKKSARRDDSDDDGAPSSVSEVESTPMSESDAETNESEEERPLYPVENKFRSEEDKERILAMPEVERESILAERAAELERIQQDSILKRLYQGYKSKDEKAAKKRKAGAANLEEGERKSSRQRTTLAGRKVGETSASLEAYKAQRERKDQLDQQRKAGIATGRGRRRDSRSPSDGEVDAESDAEWAEGRPKVDYDEPADLVDYNRVLVGRKNFALVCFYPNFEQAVKDCYVRVSVGPDPNTGEPCYRMAKIVGVTEKEPYAIEGINGKNFVTNQYVVAAVGRAEKSWPFIFCSMTRFTERELARYKSLLATDGQPLPSKRFLVDKIDDINKLVNHQFSEKELQEKLERAGVLKEKANAIERQSLFVQRRDAENRGNLDAVVGIDHKLKALDGPQKLAFGTTLHKAENAKPREKTQQERLAEINRANRKANTENVRRAQLAEQRAQAAHRRAVERGEAVADPFARVKVMAKTHFDVNAPNVLPAPRAATPSRDTPKPVPKANGAVANGDLKVELKNATFDWAEFDQMAAFSKTCQGPSGEKRLVFRRKPCVHEVLASYDFGLDDLVRPDAAGNETTAEA